MRIGVIGWGLRKSVARLAHRPEQGHELVALADPSEAARAQFATEYPEAATVSDYREMLNLEIDAVFVLSPDFLHEEHATAVLRAGKSTFLEKPMSITVEGCDRLLDVANETGTRFYVGHNMRHFGVILEMKRLIDEGRIGKVKSAWCRHFVAYGGDAYFKDWHADRTKSTGLLLQKGAHDIDVLHFLCGGYTRKVTAFGALSVFGDLPKRDAGIDHKVSFSGTFPATELTGMNPVVDVEDLNMVLMELDNGVLASYQHCMYSPDAWRNYTIIGTHGRIENFGDTPGSAVVKLWNRYHGGYSETADEEIVVPGVVEGHGGSDTTMMDEVLRYFAKGGETRSTPTAAREAVATGVAATASLREGGQPKSVLARS